MADLADREGRDHADRPGAVPGPDFATPGGLSWCWQLNLASVLDAVTGVAPWLRDAESADSTATDSSAADSSATDSPAADSPATDSPAADSPATDSTATASTSTGSTEPAEGAAHPGSGDMEADDA